MTAQEEAQIALEQLAGLCQLELRGMHVRKSREAVLNKLSVDALPIVAAALARNATPTK